MMDKIFNDDTLAQIVQVQAIEISQLQSQLTLSLKPEEPVGREELANEIEAYMGDDTFSYHDLATNLLSTFNITRKV